MATEAEIREEARKKAQEKTGAVVPLSSLSVEDVNAAGRKIDAWLKEISKGYVTLEMVKNVAGSLPVVGNIFAACDMVLDLIDLIKDKTQSETARFFNWVSLGINMIGIIPMPPGITHARMTLRPTIHLIRSKLKKAANTLGNVIVDLLIIYLSDSIAGKFDKYIDEAINRLGPMMDSAAGHVQASCNEFADILTRACNGTLFKVLPKKPPAPPKHNPKEQYPNAWEAVWGGLTAGVKKVGEKVEQAKDAVVDVAKSAGVAGVNETIRLGIKGLGLEGYILGFATSLRSVSKSAQEKLREQATKSANMTIMVLLVALKNAVVQYYLKRKATKNAAISPANQAQAKVKAGNEKIEHLSVNAVTTGDGACCKNKGRGTKQPKLGTTGSISFATGSETIIHTDFELPGVMPIVWSRTYYSRLGAYDKAGAQNTAAYLGARWTTPYTTRIDQRPDGSLIYHAADGRSHTFPALAGPVGDKPGQVHYNGIEMLTLGRGNDTLLVLGMGKEYVETFELAPEFTVDGKVDAQNKTIYYRLATQKTATGQTTTLQYRHAGGQLSDIISGESHVCTALDEAGRIASLWLVEEGQATRQLAAYTYQSCTDGSSNLIAAQDQYQQGWSYDYLPEPSSADGSLSTHLVTRYSDRTYRNIHLQWLPQDGFDAGPLTLANSPTARAWREKADDGSFDTTIVWNENVRLTTVIDANGAETQYYFDILGYVCRIVYPEVTDPQGRIFELEEWFFRDDNKNITTHVMQDGSSEVFTWDAQSNLLSHTRADGSTVHYAYDEEDHLTGIADAEGHHWLRSYSGPNLTEEIDPLGNKTEYAYNEAGLPVEITDAKGGKKQLAYNSAGQLTAYTDCSGKTTTWSYDSLGQLASTTNAAGETTRYTYQRGQFATITAPDGAVQQLHYDAEGRLLQHTDPLGQTTQYSYTQAGLIAGRKDALGHTLAYQWDKTGRLTALQNENHQLHTFAYDPAGKLLKEVHFDGIETRYLHTPETGILSEVLEGNSATLLEFDPLGRLLERKTGLMHPVQHTDPATGVPYTTQQVQADTITTDSYAYDGNGLLTDASNSHISLQWFHDAAGNLTSEHHHYAAEGARHTAVWHHQYDELGNRIATTRPDGQHIQWLTYGSGHIHGLLINGAEQLAYERDDLHRETERHQANSLTYTQQWDEAGRLKAQLLSKQQPGSNAGTIPAQGNTHSLHIQRQYRYDKAGQLTGIADTRRGQISYKYDPVGRLLQAHSQLGNELFAFDPASNILDKGAHSLHNPNNSSHTAIQAGDASNRQGHSYSTLTGPKILTNLLKHYAGTHYQYDERGNLIERIHNGITTTFTWNAANQMTSSTSGEITTRYQYDPLGRRIAKIKSNQLNTGQSQHTLYGWDGDQLAWESTHTHLTEQAQQHVRNLRASGQEALVPPPSGTTHYIFEPDSFIPVLQGKSASPMREHMLARPKSFVAEYTDENGDYSMDADPLFNGEYNPENQPAELTNICIYQCDHLGTPMELTDENGNIAWSAEYKAWGEAKVQSLWTTAKAGAASKTSNPFRFQGQYFDEETGLHYNRFRYYDPHSGRFISKDPIGLLGGINTFQYAPNTTEWIDPFGLCRCTENLHNVVEAMKKVSQELAKYDPAKDAIGGFKMRGGGITKPCGHYKEIRQEQLRIKNNLDEYRRCNCHKRKDRRPSERPTVIAAEGVRYQNIVIPPGCKYLDLNNPASW